MAAYEIPGLTLGLEAAEAMATQYLACKVNSSTKFALADGTAGERWDGILQNDPASGEVASVMLNGISKAVLGGTVTEGDELTVNTSAKLLKATFGQWVSAIALKDGVANDIIPVLLGNGHPKAGGYWHIPITLANVADGDVVTTFTPGFAGTIEKLSFIVTTAVTTAAKATTLNMEIGTTNLTNGTVALTSANCTPLGAVIDNGTAPSANNTFTSSSTISVEAASTTAFVEGAGVLVVRYSIDQI